MNSIVSALRFFFTHTIGRPELARKAIWSRRPGLDARVLKMFRVEAANPGRPGRNNFEVHHVRRNLGFMHIEGLCNLELLVDKGRFQFFGFPLKIKGGTGSPIRAVSMLEE
jgi:kynurenine formamidase